MMQNLTKTITRKNEDDEKFQNLLQKIISMIVYMYKKYHNFKIIYDI